MPQRCAATWRHHLALPPGAQPAGLRYRCAAWAAAHQPALRHLPARLHGRLQSSVKATYGYANDWGIFYGGKGYQLGVQVLGVVIIAAWACSLSALMFLAMKKVGGLAGMPLCCHGWQEPM